MIHFFRSLFLILGPLVPEGDSHWLLLIKLKAIVEIAFIKTIHKSTHIQLDKEITEYLKALSNLYPNHFKPKHHFLIHYPRIMKKIGPLTQVSSLRNESKHKEGKVTSHVSICRKNICHTIGCKHQLMLNYKFLVRNKNIEPFTTGPTKSVNFEDKDSVSNIYHLLPFTSGMKVTLTNWIIFLGRKIKCNCFITMFSEDGPKFYLVAKIIVLENNIQIVSKLMHDCFLIEHFKAYKIFNNNNFSFCTRNKLSDGYYYIAKHWM